jgi:L-fucose mutarotase/ribose pyranase (RbsD/FucU family)
VCACFHEGFDLLLLPRRFAFYEKARGAFAVVQTAERRPYACFLLQKVRKKEK